MDFEEGEGLKRLGRYAGLLTILKELRRTEMRGFRFWVVVVGSGCKLLGALAG